MAYIEPNTTIKFLVGVPFDPTYENTMYFASAAEQEAWMLNKTLYTFDRNSYQRVSRGKLKVGWVADTLGSSVINQLYSSNYMMFKNTNFENKWFYAFVTNVEYVNNNTVEVSYVIDVVQTWLFQFRFNQCLIEREHTTTDVVGDHLVEESLETGDYMFDRFELLPITPCVVLAITSRPSGAITDPWVPVDGRLYHGRAYDGISQYNTGDYFTGVELLAARLDDAVTLSSLNTYLKQVTETGGADTIVGMSIMPFEFLSQDGSAKAQLTREYNIPSSLGTYTPRNKKLLTWPYSGLYVTDMHGGGTIFRFEYFTKDNTNKVRLSYWGNCSTDPGIILFPVGYKNNSFYPDYDDVMSCSGFPMCGFNYDTYKAWLAQNASTLVTSSLKGIVSTASSALAPSANRGASVAESAFGTTIDLLGEIYRHSILPETSAGNSNGSLMYQAGLLTFLIGHKYIRPEFASIIDSFFDMYGYATHRVGLPNLNARPCYSYVKTVGASIDGRLPASVCRELEGVFNKGIRFWKTSAVFGSFDPGVNDNRV